MNDTKWTPGPWKKSAVNIYSEGDDGANVATVSSPRSSSIVGFRKLEIGDPDFVEATANAHLISAAPELYEAVSLLLSDCYFAPDENDDKTCLYCMKKASHEADCLIGKTERVLSKARGGQ